MVSRFHLVRVPFLAAVAVVSSLLATPALSSASGSYIEASRANFTAPHTIGSTVNIPTGFDSSWISSGFMKHSGLGKVSILKVEASRIPRSILVTNGPKSYEVGVLVRACANAEGFKSLIGSRSADIADSVSSHLFLFPQERRGINGFYFGIVELPVSGAPTSLIRGRALTLAPTMKPNQCFIGVVSYAVPIQIGSPSNATTYSVILNSNTFPIGSQAILWSPPKHP